MENSKKRKIIFYFINVLIVAFVTALTINKIIVEKGVESFSHLHELSVFALIVLSSMFFVNYFFEGLIISVSMKEYDDTIKVKQGIVGHCVGALFSAITPLKVGYFPGLSYVYSKYNVKGENMIKAMAKTGFSNQLLMLLFSFITFVVCCVNPISVYIGDFSLSLRAVSIIGVVYNIALMGGYLLLVLSPQLHNFILRVIAWIGVRFKILNDSKTYYETKKEKMRITREEIRKYIKNIKQNFIIFSLFFIKNFVYLGMPYVVYLLLSNESFKIEMWLYTIVLWNLITCITNIIPIPGASGTAEIAFIAIFSLIFKPESLITSVMLVWRVFSYFANVIVGFIVFFVMVYIKKK